MTCSCLGWSGTVRIFPCAFKCAVPRNRTYAEVSAACVCSILALESCDGYIPNSYHTWCCTARQCNILYTQQALKDLGYPVGDDLEYISCVEKGAADIASENSPADPVVDGNSAVGDIVTDSDSEASPAPVSMAMRAGSWLACMVALVLFTYA